MPYFHKIFSTIDKNISVMGSWAVVVWFKYLTYAGCLKLMWGSASGLLCCLSLQWCHNEWDSVSNHRRLHCLLNCRSRCRSKKTSKLCVTGLFAGNSPVMGEFPPQKASNEENVSIWWHHHVWVNNPDSTAVTKVEQITLWTHKTPHSSPSHVSYDMCCELFLGNQICAYKTILYSWSPPSWQPWLTP